MREILFRGKQEYKNKEWVFGSLHSEYGETDKNGQRKIDYRILGMRGECDYVLSETFGQFTGLTDKNGKKIFEGDIIKIPDDYDEFGINAGEVYEVYFSFGGFRLKPKRSNAKGFWLEDDKTVEILGNIHDNPELLENP